MKQYLSESDRSYLEQRIRDTENRTNLQIVLATTGRSDSYPEIPWKAFAAGVSIGSLLVFAGQVTLPAWFTATTLLVSIVAILATGSLSAILTVFWPVFARVFLSGIRSELEIRQYAISLYLEHELFMTEKRTGILILISKLERKIYILPDKGLEARLSKGATEIIIARMSDYLRNRKFREAFEAGLDELANIMPGNAGIISAKNELPDEIIERNDI